MLRHILLIAAAALAAITLAGCNPTITSPFTGKPVNEHQLDQEAKAAAAAEVQAQLEKDAAAKTELRERTAATEVEALEIRAQADQAALNAETRLRSIAITHDAAVGAITERSATNAAALAAALQRIQEQKSIAQAEIDLKREQALGVAKFITDLPVVNQAAGAAGISTVGVAGLLGLLLGRKSKDGETTTLRAKVQETTAAIRTEADKAWEEAYAKGFESAHAQFRAREDEWDKGQADLLKTLGLANASTSGAVKGKARKASAA